MPAGRSVSFVHFNLSMRTSYYFIVFYLYANNKVDIIYMKRHYTWYSHGSLDLDKKNLINFGIELNTEDASFIVAWKLFNMV